MEGKERNGALLQESIGIWYSSARTMCVKTAHNMHALITTRTHGEVRPTRSGI